MYVFLPEFHNINLIILYIYNIFYIFWTIIKFNNVITEW